MSVSEAKALVGRQDLQRQPDKALSPVELNSRAKDTELESSRRS